MRELLLLDLAGFGCGVWKEDILSHEEQIIHWLTDNNGAATAIAMMGAHPVSLADLSYCIGLAPAVRTKRHPVLVPADHDLSVSFVVEQEAGMAQVPSSAVFFLPPYLQTAFIDSCVQLDGKKFGGKLVPLINIQAIHCQLLAGHYTPPPPQFLLPGLNPSLAALRVFTCNKKSFAASADYFFSEQAVSPGVLTALPLMPEFVRGITLHNNQIFTVFDIRRYLQLSSATEDEEKKWLIGAVEGQGFAFVIDADLGLLSADSASLAALPLLVRSSWQQRVAIHDRKIIPVLDLREMLARQPDEIRSQTLPRNVGSDGRFEAVFGKQQIEIVEFSLCKMVHALPDLEVADIISFSHCQRLTGTRGLVVGVTLYRKELLPVLDPARCYGRESRPVAGWKLLLICNGDLRVLVLAEDILGKRSLNISEQRALPFTAPHSSVYGCYPVAGRVGLIFNILALVVFFDDEQINELFFFADDLLPPVNDVEPNIELDIELDIDQGTFGEVILEQEEGLPLSSLESVWKDPADDWELQKNASVLLTEEQDSLVQFVVASMLSRKKEVTEAADAVEKDGQDETYCKDDDIVAGFLKFAAEPEGVVDIIGDICEESDDIFPSVVAAMLSRREDDRNTEVESRKSRKSRKSKSSKSSKSTRVDSTLEAAPILLTDEQDSLITSTLASILLREKVEASVPEIHEESGGEQEGDVVPEKLQIVTESPEPPEPLDPLSPPESFESIGDDEDQSDTPAIIFTEEQNALLQSSLVAAFSQEEEEEGGEGEAEEPPVFLEQSDESGSIEGLQSADAINTVFFPSAAARDDDKNEDVIDSDDEQTEKTTGKEVVPDIEIASSGEKKDLFRDIPVQLKDREEAPVESDTSNVLDADDFPELKDFVRQVSETQQADSSFALPQADFLKNVTFPPLFSPDPRKIKERLDKMRQKEQDVLFLETVHELEGVPDAQSKDEDRKCAKLWMVLLLLALISGFLLWFFFFRNQEISRGQSMKSESQRSQLSGVSSEASPEIQNTPAQPIVSSPVLSESESELKSESALVDQEAIEQEILMEEITEGKIIEASVDQLAQAIPERTATGNPSEKFLEQRGADPEVTIQTLSQNGRDVARGSERLRPESVSENDETHTGKQQGENEEDLVGRVHKETGTAQVWNDEKREEQKLPVPAALTERDRRNVDQEKINSGELSEEITTPAYQKNSPLMSPVKHPSDYTRHTVSKGETLWKISEQYTGSGFNYLEVAKKNKIANPDMIYPNQQVTLPAEK